MVELDAARATGTGVRFEPQIGHGASVQALAVSARGRRVATVAADGSIRIWDTDAGRVLRSMRSTQVVRCSLRRGVLAGRAARRGRIRQGHDHGAGHRIARTWAVAFTPSGLASVAKDGTLAHGFRRQSAGGAA